MTRRQRTIAMKQQCGNAHEFLDFVGGRLSRQFVRDEADLARRFAARALGPDPDGRHRVNEFFCHDDTWRPTMLRLAQAADVVLMDLRGFTPQNQGCRYELQQLLDFVALERVLVLIDADAPRLALWVHSAGVGRKVDAFNREPRVAIEMDVQEGLITGTYACAYSYAYRSIMGTGTIHRIQGIEAKRYGLTRIMQHLAPEASTDFTDQALARANIYCIDIDRFSGKQRA